MHVDLMSEDKIALKVRAKVRKLKYTNPRKTQYVAKLGEIDAIADTEADAKSALAAKVEQIASEIAAPSVLFDLVEPDKVWVAHHGPEGWGYLITRRVNPFSGHPGMSQASGCGGHWTQQECLTRMREHWYQCNAIHIVNGIVALCTSWREWSCPKCHYGQQSFAPYVCASPACRHKL